ncbi:MAG: phosphohistidine phosphatase SixA [Limisphaera sp.]|nr:phosphohistidine phosphatase SixA [Limisphaera sp.]
MTSSGLVKLYLLRHAEAVDATETASGKDEDRALTPRGRRRARALAHALRQRGIQCDLVWTSPLVRARQTADILARGLRLGRAPVVVESLAPDQPPRHLVAELQALRPLPDAMMLVGHEPFLSRLAALLCTGDPDGLDLTLKKCGLCRLELDSVRAGRCATLEWLISPRWFDPE